MAPNLSARMTGLVTGAWLARHWYLTRKTRRAYSVRQVSPGDRRLLAEFTHELGAEVPEMMKILFDRVIPGGNDAAAVVALENADAGDRVIGVCAYASSGPEGAEFIVAVANSHREEQVGRTLLATLLRQAKRVGVRRLTGEMNWSNRAMHALASSMGFQVLPLPSDRNGRLLVLELK